MKGWFPAAAGTVLLWTAWALLSDVAAQSFAGHQGVLLEIAGAGVVGLVLYAVIGRPPYKPMGALWAVASGLFSISGILFFSLRPESWRGDHRRSGDGSLPGCNTSARRIRSRRRDCDASANWGRLCNSGRYSDQCLT